MSATLTVDQSRLVLQAFAAQFQNNLIAADLCEWNQFSGEMNDRNGLSVTEQIDPRYAVSTTTNGVADLSSGVNGSAFGSETYTVNKTFNTNMGWADFASIKTMDDARQSRALKQAAVNLAEYIDSYILGVCQKASNNWLGTPGTGITTWTDFAQGYTRLKEEGVDDSDLRAVLTYGDRQTLGSTVIAYAAPDGLVTNTFRKGFSGEIDGIPISFTQQLPTLTVGSRAASGAALINGASQNSNYSAVCNSTSTNGRWLTQTIAIDGLTGSQTVKAGEVFTIAGVYAYDNRAQVSTGRLQQFTVVDDATASSGAIAALRIFPAIIVPASGSGDDVNINTAHATVDSAPADNAAITWLGTASTAYRPRFIMQKQAIVVETLDLPTPFTDTYSRQALSKVPLSVRMWKHSDFATGAHSVRFDCALTANVRERRRIVRINGN